MLQPQKMQQKTKSFFIEKSMERFTILSMMFFLTRPKLLSLPFYFYLFSTDICFLNLSGNGNK